MFKLIPFDKKNIPGKGEYAKTKNYTILMEFIESGIECAKLEGWTHRDEHGAAASMNNSAKKFRLGVRAIARKGEVYLIKTTT
jgi:hypothetical protein